MNAITLSLELVAGTLPASSRFVPRDAVTSGARKSGTSSPVELWPISSAHLAGAAVVQPGSFFPRRFRTSAKTIADASPIVTQSSTSMPVVPLFGDQPNTGTASWNSTASRK